ncbi:deoxynucleoside triphosphate triphosphohydrolase SAMHD1-like [Hoplias malabaricus]|uniref:deoxynucleoside triphosphate triphosphohydrolase SAMHD1-like n=1 Tax=Hoplias malabaricus TaxID=27720 RepID=UPI003462203D
MTTDQGSSNQNKIFNDSVHGHIEIHPLLVKIIDTPEFQRLRNIKQLGAGYFVFPGASHNRFEHSIGVAHLAGKLVQTLKDRQRHLNISEKDVLCVQIAGLCHDLGHGPFSHVFEVFMKEKGKKWKHEQQSVKMFEKLIQRPHVANELKKYSLLNQHILLIKEFIDTSREMSRQDISYLYEVVANERTGIDVDKMDYLIRDCHHLGMKSDFSHERYMMFAKVVDVQTNGKQICMRDKEAMNMYELFHIRNRLHQSAYQHRVVKAIELMIVDVLLEADETLKISAAVDNPKDYTNLTDEILHQIQCSNIEKAKNIIKRISECDLYKFFGGKMFDPNDLKDVLDDSDKYKKRYQSKLTNWMEKVRRITGESFKPEEFKVVPVKFSYGKEMKNPIEFLNFYKKNNPNHAEPLSKNESCFSTRENPRNWPRRVKS